MLTTLHTFENYQQVHLFKSKLESEGIASYTFDDQMMNLIPMYNVTIGGIKLKVSEADLPKAQQLLEEWNVNLVKDENGNLIECPECGSREVIHHFISMRGIKGVLSAISAFIFMIFPLHYKLSYYCKGCKNIFKLQQINSGA